MEKKNQWRVTVEDKVYDVRCVTMKTLFEVYVDGELALKVPRKMRNDDSDSEYDIRIGGKRCQFVIYDGVPDVCVDGILLGAQREMDEKAKRNRRLMILGGIFCIITSSYATFLWVIYEIGGNPIFGGVLSLIFIQIFFFGGIALVLAALKRKKREY
jgi:hypothetical protein